MYGGGLGANISGWKTGEWHHIALTWEQKGNDTEASLYLDGRLVSTGELDRNYYGGIGDEPVGDNLIGDKFVLGRWMDPDEQLRSGSNSVFDELKIYNYAKDNFNVVL